MMPWRTDVHLWITLTPFGLELGQERLGVVAGGLHDLDARGDDGVDVFVVGPRHQRRQDRQVHAERLVGHLAAARDLLHEILGCRLRQRREEPERTGVGHGRGQLGATDPLHAALHDGVLHPEHLRESRADHCALSYARRWFGPGTYGLESGKARAAGHRRGRRHRPGETSHERRAASSVCRKGSRRDHHAQPARQAQRLHGR